MSEFAERHIAELEEALADSERQLFAMQTILALILDKNGEAVVITHEEVVRGLPEGTQIFIDEDPQTLEHTIGLVFPVDSNA